MSTNRRGFVKSSIAAGGILGGVAQASASFVKPEKLRLGLIGPGGMGSNHLKLLVNRTDVEVNWICEVDKDRLAKAAKTVESAPKDHAPKTTADKVVFPVPESPNKSDDWPVLGSDVAEQCMVSMPFLGPK